MSRAAIRYAKAVLDLAQDKGNIAAVLKDMNTVKDTLESNKELRTVLSNPIVKGADKEAILKEVFSGATAETTGIIGALVSNGRANLLASVADSFITEYNKINKVEAVTVTTAVPISKEIEAKVLEKVTELTGSTNISIDNVVDQDIIGGFVLRVGDMQYNASIANQLNKLKREFSISL